MAKTTKDEKGDKAAKPAKPAAEAKKTPKAAKGGKGGASGQSLDPAPKASIGKAPARRFAHTSAPGWPAHRPLRADTDARTRA